MATVKTSTIDTIHKYIGKLRDQGMRINAVYLFGSFARGTEHQWSDIDIAIISPDLSDDRFEARVRLMKVSAELDARIEPAPFRPEDFIDDDPLVWEIKKDGILISTGDERPVHAVVVPAQRG